MKKVFKKVFKCGASIKRKRAEKIKLDWSCSVEFEFEDDYSWATLYSTSMKKKPTLTTEQDVEKFILSQSEVSIIWDKDRNILTHVE